MPLPKPKLEETSDAFMRRCMTDDIASAEYPESSQRYAVCKSLWENKNKQLIKRFVMRQKARKCKM